MNTESYSIVLCYEYKLNASLMTNNNEFMLFFCVPHQVPSVLFAPHHLLALFTLGIPSGLIMDCGYSETMVLPISLKNYLTKVSFKEGTQWQQ